MTTTRTLARNLSCAALSLLGSIALSAPAKSAEVEIVKSPQGITAWLVENHSTPMIAATILFKGGQTQDPSDKPGLANFANCMFNEGAGQLRTNELVQKLHIDLSGKFEKSAGDEIHTFTVRSLTETRDEVFQLVGAMFQEPRFDEDAMARCRDEISVAIDSAAADSGSQLILSLFGMLYPDHPLSRSTMGTKASIASITREDILDYRRRVLAKDNMMISVVGDINAAALGVLLDRTLGGLPERADIRSTPDLPAAVQGVKVLEYEVPQASIAFASPITLETDLDRATADIILQVVGGGGLESLLMTELRENRGLVYGASASRSSTSKGDRFFGWVQTDNDKVAETVAVYKDVLKRAINGGISEDDVARAKSVLKGTTLISSRFSQAIASALTGNQYWGKGPKHFSGYSARIDAVTMDDVRRVAAQILKPEALTIVIAGKGVKL